jgi:putative intracellular protease/amidase
MKALFVALFLVVSQSQAKVLVLIPEADPSIPNYGINLHEIATLIGLSYYQGRVAMDFATPTGQTMAISGQALEPKNYPASRKYSRVSELENYQAIFGRANFNKAGTTPPTQKFLDDWNRAEEERMLGVLPPQSLREIVETEKLAEYSGLIVLGGTEALYTFPQNIDVRSAMTYFYEKNLPIALSGYGLAALTSPGATPFAGYPVAAIEPLRNNPVRLDRLLTRSGLTVISVLNGDPISVREGKLITAQDWKTFEKLLEEFLPQIPQEAKIPVQN